MSERILVSTRKGLFTLERKGRGKAGTWRITTSDFLGDNVTLAMHDPRSGKTFAALNHGHFGVKLHRSKGKGFEEIAAPAYPPKPDGLSDKDGWGKEIPYNLINIFALEPGGPKEKGLIWCGTVPGALFVSRDNGASWEMARSLWDHPGRKKWMGGGLDWPSIHSICVDPRDSKHLTIAVSCAGVWATRDGGASWHVLGKGLVNDYMPPEQADSPDGQDPHRVVACPVAPDVLWMQHHCGIFLSQDAGANWKRMENVQPSAFGFAVVVHPSDPRRAWFVPGVKDESRYACDGAVCVTETRDGGASFTVHRAGLPQDHAYHLVYRHCLDITRDGATLAFGSTTGSLWASANSGASWERISAELPPIYCVRFGRGACWGS